MPLFKNDVIACSYITSHTQYYLHIKLGGYCTWANAQNTWWQMVFVLKTLIISKLYTLPQKFHKYRHIQCESRATLIFISNIYTGVSKTGDNQ